MLKNLIKRLPMLKHNCKRLLFKQNYKEICLRLNTWYTISGVHNTNKIHTLKTLEFLRYELEILSALLMWNNFIRVLALVKLLYDSYISNCRSSLLYIEVWKICCWLPAHQKKVVWSLIKSPIICCLIWLLSYEGSILNPFQVWRNTVIGTVVVLVLADTKTE